MISWRKCCWPREFPLNLLGKTSTISADIDLMSDSIPNKRLNGLILIIAFTLWIVCAGFGGIFFYFQFFSSFSLVFGQKLTFYSFAMQSSLIDESMSDEIRGIFSFIFWKWLNVHAPKAISRQFYSWKSKCSWRCCFGVELLETCKCSLRFFSSFKWAAVESVYEKTLDSTLWKKFGFKVPFRLSNSDLSP